MMQHTCTRILEFDAAHRVPKHAGKCQHLHGHRYKAEITCTADRLNAIGVVVDFADIKKIVGSWIDANLDHNTIYDQSDELMYELASTHKTLSDDYGVPHKDWHGVPFAPTAENLAKYIYDESSVRLLQCSGLRVWHVRLWETPNCYADWGEFPDRYVGVF